MTDPATSARPASAPATIRPATIDDAAALAAMHDAAWRETYAGLMSPSAMAAKAEYNDRRWPQRLADPRGPQHWLAERDGAVVAFAWAVAAGPPVGDDPPPRPLELVGIYVLAREQGTGTGQRLLDVTIGDAPCFLWVAEANARARRFYERNAFVLDGARRTVPSWDAIEIVRMVR
ncbi:GCN5-related protein N-acetyltransferase [Beutenbergia cavernae DSM 12333]|uniref:GCN5-related protein N-acetyltransferase n=1 Tax=Beutenbergia cavernae (strain ATCC BAA-8 / DSM 12333 / CCUG 43141 / JCM 11478 / NBRC 16432 / NCIMB 13614 / HKI 0122) TaxID=471853 RepID=C5C1X0_BEUC1|nr:GNAT family N-acetyltransferase [Beutenbergia cavernae]ACQ79588.1 GCN5-related protein N-acetyltransferase [Beutenbergia cavernae DSM 12333]